MFRVNKNISVKKPVLTAVAVTLCGVGLQACMATKQLIEERPAAALMDPMEKVVLFPKTRFLQLDSLDNNAERYWDVTAVNADGSYQGTAVNGCSWTNDGTIFSPSLTWDNCGKNPEWKSGRIELISSSGSLWPLELGNTASWKYTDYSTVNGKKGSIKTRKCEVVGVVNITVAQGDLDTYKVQCKHRTGGGNTMTRTWYMHPEKGEVKYVRRHSTEGVRAIHETTGVTAL